MTTLTPEQTLNRWELQRQQDRRDRLRRELARVEARIRALDSERP